MIKMKCFECEFTWLAKDEDEDAPVHQAVLPDWITRYSTSIIIVGNCCGVGEPGVLP